MDYEKLHKDTIAKLQEMVNSGKITVKTACGICADFVPESEDERMVKFIKNQLFNIKKTITDNYKLDTELTKAIDWLEKQGEHANFRNKIQIGDKVTRNKDGVLVNLSQLNRVAKKQGEQKPAVWSDEDEEMLKSIKYHLDCDNADIRCYGWLEELKDRVQPQPKQEWSEEDEQMYIATIYALAGFRGNEVKLDWLKSLKDRYAWKPSDEQMEGIECTIKTLKYQLNCGDNRLDSLYNDLKKLRGE